METASSLHVTVNHTALIAFIGYLVLVTAIGILTSRFSSAGTKEYFLAGRKLNRFVVALSAVVSGRSGWLLLGFTGMAYKLGASAVWAAVGYITVEFFLFFYYARRLRRFSEHHNCITLPDFYAARFGDKNGSLRILLVTIIVIFMISYIASQFVAGGKAFAAGFNLSTTQGINLTAGIVLFYTLLGGFLAVSLTDVLQAFFMIIALLVLPLVVIHQAGGWHEMWQQLTVMDPDFGNPFAIGAGMLFGFLGIGLGSPGNPHILVRYMSIKDTSQLKTSAWVGTAWNILMALGALFIGLAGRFYFPDSSMIPGADTEHLYPALAQAHLPPILYGVVIASIFAAIMSTADSQLLVAASGIIHDLYAKVFRRNREIPQRLLVFYSRLAVVILVGLAIIIGMTATKIVFWLVLFAWAGLGASIGPTSILALYWKGTTKKGVIYGMIAGTVTTIVWYYTPALKGFLYELIPAFFTGIIVTIAVSLFTQKPDSVDKMFHQMVDSENRDHK